MDTKETKSVEELKQFVVNYFNERASKTTGTTITTDDVVLVSYNYMLGFLKLLLTTTVQDGQYYELTYNKPKDEYYLDVYKRWDNKAVKIDREHIDTDDFIEESKTLISKYFNEHNKKANELESIDNSDVFAIWTCYTIGNLKGWFSTRVSDGMCYTCTYRKESGELYFDAYKKWEHVIY